MSKMKPLFTAVSVFALSGCFGKGCSPRDAGDKNKSSISGAASDQSDSLTEKSAQSATVNDGGAEAAPTSSSQQSGSAGGALKAAGAESVASPTSAQPDNAATEAGAGATGNASSASTTSTPAASGASPAQTSKNVVQVTSANSAGGVANHDAKPGVGAAQAPSTASAKDSAAPDSSQTPSPSSDAASAVAPVEATKGPYKEDSGNHPPEFSALPTLVYDGTPAVGQALTCQFTAIDWDKDDQIKTKVLWQSAVSADGPWSNLVSVDHVYVPTAADSGRLLRCNVTASDKAGASVQGQSKAVTIPALAAAATGSAPL